MRTLLAILPLFCACSMKTLNTDSPSLMGAQLEILNVNKAIVSEVTAPELIQARIYAPVDEIERLTVEWWSVEDGLLSVQQPDSLGRIQFNTIQLSAGMHSIFANLKEGDHIIQQERLLVVMNRPDDIHADITYFNDLSAQYAQAASPHPLLVSNRLMGCDGYTNPQDIWFCAP